MNQDIHMVWVGDKFSLLEQLTIKLYQKQNLIPNLWCYNPIENVPENVVIRDAKEILPEKTLFKFNNEDRGSAFSQWSDRFQLKLLQKFGGWYSQLDVACLKLPTESEYFFAPHLQTIVDVCIMKTPINAPFIENCIKELTEKINESTASSFAWEDSMRIIGNHVKSNDLTKFISNNVQGCGYKPYMRGIEVPPVHTEFIHWWNAECSHIKDKPIKGTFYYKLLEDTNLI